MARKSDAPISNKHARWDYEQVSGLPYSGLSVEQFLKEWIDSKAGVFYYDANNNRFLVFADEENRDLYLDDPTEYANLLIGTFDAPFNYSASITLIDTQTVNYIKSGSTGNYINATFDVVNKEGASVGENVNVTITFRNGSSTSTIIRAVPYGSQLTLNIDDYLAEGTNVVTLAAIGQNTLAATSIGLTYYAINLQLSDSFDISSHISPVGNLDIAFNVIGNGIKRLQWFIDGVQVPYDSQNDDVTATEASRTKTIPLSSYNLTNGRHNLQYRAYIEAADGTLFYSDTLFRDFIVDNGHLNDFVTVTAFDFPYTSTAGNNGIIDPLTEPISIYGVTQYMPKEIQYAVNAPFGEADMTITLEQVSSVNKVSNSHVYTYEMQPFYSGNSYLSFSFGTDILEFNVSIAESSYSDLEEVTNGLVFAMDKSDSTNTANDRSDWHYGQYSATMTGFSWTDRSGWTTDGLLIPDGASFVTDFSPLATEAVNTGLTLEVEFATERVLDDSAVICDLRTGMTGLLITASEASLTSRGGISVSTKYKSGVPLRVSFVVNPPSAIRNKNLLFIYIDGILAGAINYQSSDSFLSSVPLQFAGSADASILLKQVRCYTRALSAQEILNNYILYRPTAPELVTAYDRNDILDSNGQPSYEKLAAFTPVIVITGDVEKLMNFDRSNKGTYVKMDKMEIINNQDPSKNLTLLNFSMRCQGTSSMDYPRKNFRFYLAKDSADTTVDAYVTRVFDASGNELTGRDRVYSFKDNAQPVNCWCLKADYAESSSTHNTGIARLWNNVLKNARVSNVDSRHYILDQYPDSTTPCRTLAQHAAVANNYDKDVRTTVDGFPIVLFYHKKETDALVCLGKYNWNNDKSTESVYGFKDIPGFDNTNMECWEVVNGDYAINQFTDLTNWSAGEGNGGWQDSFESRYPDDAGKPSEALRAEGALKTVATWINSTYGAAAIVDNKIVVGDATLMNKFSSEKWLHLDVYKMAAYYVYLMRFGGVDQTVKNAMFTTEDGQHWFYINYDNDTILGVRNDGLLRFGYDIDRQSKDPDNANAYCYAGHDSVLWNNLEADSEFMNIVKVVDQALFEADLTYPNVINMFNVQQSGRWGERIHNYDYTYKYLDVWLDDANMQLEKLQGPRRTHREWWLSNRFAIFDAKNMTGQYLKSYVSIKPSTDGATSLGDIVKVVPAVDDQVFGWRLGTNGTIYSDTGSTGDIISFDLYAAGISYYIGGSLFFFNAAYMDKIDFSAISSHISELSFASVNSDVIDSYLEDVTVSKTTSVTNTAMTAVSNLGNVKYLRKFEMCNFTNVASVDFSGNIYLEDIDLRGCTALTSVNLPEAAPIVTIQLPNSIQALTMKDLVDLTSLTLESNGASVRTINAINCKPFSDSLTWLKSWMTGKSDEYLATCSVVLEGIHWTNVSVADLLAFGKIGSLTFRGTIQANINDPENQIPALQAIYGEHCFDSTNELWISGESRFTIFLGPDTVVEGRRGSYQFVVIGAGGTVEYRIQNNTRAGVTINSLTGDLDTSLTNEADSTLQVQAVFTPTDGSGYYPPVATKEVTILKETYPSNSDITISGQNMLNDTANKTYTAVVANTDSYTGWDNLRHQWSLLGDLASDYMIASQSSTELVCTLSCVNTLYIVTSGKLRLEFINCLNNVVAYKEYDIIGQSGAVAVSRMVNPEVMSAFWDAYGTSGTKQAGVLSNADYITKSEASGFTSDMLGNGTAAGSIFYKKGVKHFEEIQHFVALTSLPAGLFSTGNNLSGDFPLPDTVTTLSLYAFKAARSDVNNLNVSGNGVLSISGARGKIAGSWRFPNCTSVALNYNGIAEGTVLYLPRCTYFNGNFYDGLGRCTITCPIQAFSVGALKNIIDLIIPKEAPSTLNGTITGIAGNQANAGNGLHSVTLEDGVTNFLIYDDCLYDVDSMSLLAVPQSKSSISFHPDIRRIGNWALAALPNLTELVLPDNISLGSNILYDTPITSLVIPSGVTTVVNTAALNRCSNGSGVMLTAGPLGGEYDVQYGWTTSIPDNAFNDFHNIKEITIPQTMTSMGANAFKGMRGLTTINCYPISAPSLGSNCFDASTGQGNKSAGTSTLYVPANATGYDTGLWTSRLLNASACNFQISYTL